MAKRSAASQTTDEGAFDTTATPVAEPTPEAVLPLPTAGGHYTRNEAGELVPYTPTQE